MCSTYSNSQGSQCWSRTDSEGRLQATCFLICARIATLASIGAVTQSSQQAACLPQHCQLPARCARPPPRCCLQHQTNMAEQLLYASAVNRCGHLIQAAVVSMIPGDLHRSCQLNKAASGGALASSPQAVVHTRAAPVHTSPQSTRRCAGRKSISVPSGWVAKARPQRCACTYSGSGSSP